MDFAPQSITALAGPSKPAPASSKSQKRLKADGVRLLEGILNISQQFDFP